MTTTMDHIQRMMHSMCATGLFGGTGSRGRVHVFGPWTNTGGGGGGESAAGGGGCGGAGCGAGCGCPPGTTITWGAFPGVGAAGASMTILLIVE